MGRLSPYSRFRQAQINVEGLPRRSSAKDVAEGLLGRTLPKVWTKDFCEGLRRRSWMNDFDEGEVSERSKSVDFIINSDLHCNLHYYSLLD